MIKMYVRTVLGDIDISNIGHCQCHEHIYLEKGYSEKVNKVLCIDDYNKSLEELKHYYSNGGRTIVDAQPIGCGRSSQKLVNLSMKSRVNIIASTGFHKLIFYPSDHWIFKVNTEFFAELMTKEIEDGMFVNSDLNYPRQQINAKAGMIKVACDVQGLDNTYKKYLLGAANVAINTGVSIQCHIEKANTAEDIVNYLLEIGVDAKSIILAHMDRSIEHLKENLSVAKKGIYMQYDTIGRFKYHSDEEEINFIKEMCDKGFENNILLGLDTTRARLLSYDGTIGLSYIREHFMENLKVNGFKNKQLDSFFIKNPIKALSKK
jgi:phosphotriesterase-related protein